MVRHNVKIPDAHFGKHWQNYIKTKFDQPMKKIKRARLRAAKAARVFPRPPGLLRPIVRCPTVAYNKKIRLGRGFTLEELKAAKVLPRQARSIGIAVDRRRKNTNEEQLKLNVERLSLYKSKLILFPRNPKNPRLPRKVVAGEATKEEVSKVVQQKKHLGFRQEKVVEEARVITEAEKNFNAVETLRNALKEKIKAGKEFGKKLNKDRS